MAHLLGIDLGTSSVRVLLVTKDGDVVSRGMAEYDIQHPQSNWAEQDPKDWWQATVQAVRQALGTISQPASVEAIGLSGQMHGTVLLDDAGSVLAPAIIWPDQRSQRQVDEITELVGAGRLIERSGSPLATGFQAATVRWIQQERPDLWRQVRHILLPKDYLRRRLTERLATDPSDASGALLLDVRTRDWSLALLDALDINPDMLPQVQPSATVAGELTHEAAEILGLPAGTPVVTGAADTAASAVGAGIVTSDTLLLTISTGGQVILPAHDVEVDTAGRIHTFCSALEPTESIAGWYQMGATLSAGMALRWLRDKVLNLQGDDAYERMTGWAEEVPPGARGLLFLPYLVGERTPHMDPQARGLFFGLTLQHARPELVRAVIEGVTFALFDAYDVLTQMGTVPDRIIMAGGGARSRLWQQIVADVFGLPVRRLTVTEQSALGAALLAGAGIGLFDLGTTARNWTTYGEPIAPDNSRHDRYLDAVALFREAYHKNRDDFSKLAALSS